MVGKTCSGWPVSPWLTWFSEFWDPDCVMAHSWLGHPDFSLDPDPCHRLKIGKTKALTKTYNFWNLNNSVVFNICSNQVHILHSLCFFPLFSFSSVLYLCLFFFILYVSWPSSLFLLFLCINTIFLFLL